MFKTGDRYIHFTKYGSVNFGIVKHVHEVNVIDTINGVIYASVSIITDKNSCLELDGSDGRIYRIIKDLSEDEIKTLRMIGHKHGHGSIESVT
jgi:energy-converting hydrogenase Eha subunit H